MKLMLGTTELADIPDDVAAQLLRLFEEPGRLRTMPRVGDMREPRNSFAQLEGSALAHLEQSQDFNIILELTATVRTLGPLVDTRAYDRLFGR